MRFAFAKKKVLSILVVVLAVTAISIWAAGYYSKKVFYLEGEKYSLASSVPDKSTYKAAGGKKIAVNRIPGGRELRIEGEGYLIEETPSSPGGRVYRVVYPDGNEYTVKAQGNSGFLLAFDEKGELVLEGMAYAGDERIMQEGEEHYLPSSLVRTAYEDYHETNGNVVVFLMAAVIFAYSLCFYRFEALQRFHFHLSYGLWVTDPEPSDFYFIMAKIGAVGGMAGAVVMALYSL